MPILRNARQERFCQALVTGKSQAEAYREAGYSETNARFNASRLAALPAVAKRTAELLSRREEADREGLKVAIERSGITKERVVAMLVEDRELARELNQIGPAVRAAELLGKEIGMFIERREQRNVDEFESMDEKELRELVKRRAAEMAVRKAEKQTKH